MKLKLGAAALALAAVGAAVGGCGGNGDDTGSGGGGSRGQDAPQDASVKEFCATYKKTAFTSGEVAADALAETGTPADIPEGARRGFEWLIDHPEGGQEAIGNEDIEAYVAYGGKAC